MLVRKWMVFRLEINILIQKGVDGCVLCLSGVLRKDSMEFQFAVTVYKHVTGWQAARTGTIDSWRVKGGKTGQEACHLWDLNECRGKDNFQVWQLRLSSATFSRDIQTAFTR